MFLHSTLPQTLQGIEAGYLSTPRLASVDNFRDVAGTHHAYQTSNGPMRPGMFYRANVLTSNDEDWQVMSSLGISHVFDLRTTNEIANEPDLLPDGAAYRQIDVLKSHMTGPEAEKVKIESPADVVALMQGANKAFVANPQVREKLGTLLTELAQCEGPAIFHCASGKDRTGWVAALLQSIAGADDATIMSDYLATNAYTAERVARKLATLPPAMAALYAPGMTVDASYLQTGLDEVNSRYGDLQRYLAIGLNLESQTILALRRKLIA
ncbi:tyrosine-protein phosphatase [Pseudomonas sichuanensis]|uniref:tyrosine-protein phosphatase n=1 Tax=Pseudomonas sichuanensis TaxID=2213015 RepID=UPI00215FCC41|nr:tyrosine-protein phosphatase [Pseudomonas sichuanensis]UVL87999.1 tyrosine-protein phosphatase [Pseudomonas sichuanensis]